MHKIVFVYLLLCIQGFCRDTEKEQSKWVLITGGAGFIGSHVNKMLHQHGYETIVLDKEITESVITNGQGIFIQGDIGDAAILDRIFTTYPVDAVIHCAAFIDVGESVKDPLKYYKNNVCKTVALLEAMWRHHVQIIVFSSSAAVYGISEEEFLNEESSKKPINPYGHTKLMIETILTDLDKAYGLRSGCLRYFNVAGGDPEGKLKNYQPKAFNLIPIILHNLKKSDGTVTIFGTDYPTPDGTCIRDYIHVMDLAAAHIASLEKLLADGPSHVYNLGNGRGYSVKEVIAAIEKVTGRQLHVIEGARRPGDSAILIANPEKAFHELGWILKFSSIDIMVEHAWMAMQYDDETESPEDLNEAM